MKVTKAEILLWLEAVKDPEIPVLSLVDLGVISEVEVHDDAVNITMTPTFVGCPALDLMKSEITEVLHKRGVNKVDIQVSFRKPWTSDMISEKGRDALKKFGLAPPPTAAELFTDIDVLEHVACPRCDSTDTELKNPLGDTLSRSIHYCNNCREAVEHLNPVRRTKR